jgi:hypothetical protein
MEVARDDIRSARAKRLAEKLGSARAKRLATIGLQARKPELFLSIVSFLFWNKLV